MGIVVIHKFGLNSLCSGASASCIELVIGPVSKGTAYTIFVRVRFTDVVTSYDVIPTKTTDAK